MLLAAVVVFCSTTTVNAQHGQDSLEYWIENARSVLDRRLRSNGEVNNLFQLGRRPKNLVFFLGDGMGIAAVSAARIYKGQRDRLENNQQPLSFEQFASAGLVKTYSFDQHVTDSAAGAMAYFWGGKVNAKTLGVTAKVQHGKCDDVIGNDALERISEQALARGMAVGLVTTTRITHATPAAMYARTATRFVESDEDSVKMGSYSRCVDIAQQLLANPAQHFKLTPKAVNAGERNDGRNIIEEWEQLEGRRMVVNDRDELLKVDARRIDHLLGIFADDHLNYSMDAKASGITSQPSLAEMTEMAIRVLDAKNPNGFLLLVEGGLIDPAEHDNRIHLALDELLEFETAITRAKQLLDPSNSLLLVTADHSHTLTIPGYSRRNESIFGSWMPTVKENIDSLPIASLMFATGPGGLTQSNATHVNRRQNLSQFDMEDAHFVSPAGVPTLTALHGGEDVGIWADGPYASLFTGTMENTDVAFLIRYLFCFEKEGLCTDTRLSEATKNHRDGSIMNSGTLGLLVVISTVSSLISLALLVVLVWLKLRIWRRISASNTDFDRSLKFRLLDGMGKSHMSDITLC